MTTLHKHKNNHLQLWVCTLLLGSSTLLGLNTPLMANDSGPSSKSSLVMANASPEKQEAAKHWGELNGKITLLVGNDLGRNGYYDQKAIAETMGEVAEVIEPEAVLAAGDVHHFEGVASVNDPLWLSNYEWVYSHPELMIPWYAVLGNHEYRGNTQAVLDYGKVSRRWCMEGRYYSKVFESKGVTVRVIMIDTTPLINKYRNDAETYPDAGKQDAEAQLKWIENELKSATEDWVIVVGHHPIVATTPKKTSERTDLQGNLEKVFDAHPADFYICGHVHNFQHFRSKVNGMDYIVNSSGSLSRNLNASADQIFKADESGFMTIAATKTSLKAFMLDANGKILYTIERKK